MKTTKTNLRYEDNKKCLDSYLEDIGNYEILNKDEEAELARRIREGDREAYEKLIMCNTKFVVFVAKEYVGRGLPLLELIEEGNIGLMKAISKFDETRGYKFASYAGWWIRQSILKAIADRSRLVRLPINQSRKIYGNFRKLRKYEQEIKKKLTDDEAAEYLGYKSVGDFQADEIVLFYPISLDDLVDEDQCTIRLNSLTKDKLEEAREEDPLQEYQKRNITQCLNDVLATLSSRQEKIIRLTYGIPPSRPHSLEEISDIFGCSRENIRLQRNKALMRLRHPIRSKILKVFYDGL